MKTVKFFVIGIFAICIVIVFAFWKYHKEYSYFKSQEMNAISQGMMQFLRGYYWKYCEYPKSGSDFIMYLEESDEFFIHTNREIPSLLKERDVIIYVDTIKNTVIVASDRSGIQTLNSSDFIDNISFLNYLFAKKSVTIFKDELLNICEWPNHMTTKLFQSDKVIDQIKMFRLRNSIQSDSIDPLDFITVYLYGKVEYNKLQFELYCDPFKGKKDLSPIIDSLNVLLYDIVVLNNIDELYVPLKILNKDLIME